MPALADTSLSGDANLQGYWQLNNSGTDNSGNSNTLTLVNGATFDSTTKRYGSHSMKLERANNEFGSVADSASMDITGDMSISLWVYQNTTTGQQSMVDKWEATGRSYRFYLTTGNALGYNTTSNTANNGSIVTETGITFGTGMWHHVGVTYDASAGAAQFYHNGAPRGSLKTGLETSIANSTTPVTIGQNGHTSNVHAVDGYVDDVAIFDRILTANEMQEIYGAGATFLLNFM